MSAQDWTCDECAEGGAAVGAFASSEDAIAAQVAVLLEYVCPQAPEELACQENLPSFWGQIGTILFPEHYRHICDDLACPEEKVVAIDNPRIGSSCFYLPAGTLSLIHI